MVTKINDKKLKVSLIINIIVVILVTMASIFMFAGIKFMREESLLEVTKLEMFKFFTVDSNIFLGVISLIMIIYEIKYLRKKIIEIPNFVYILKLVGTSSIALTFLITLFFLCPQYGFYSLYNNSNLFFHLTIPVLAIISYLFFEPHNNKYKYAVYGIIPVLVYSIYYTSMVLLHLNDGGLTLKYDFYGFLKGNINNIYIVMPIIYIISYLISLGVIYLNKKIGDYSEE